MLVNAGSDCGIGSMFGRGGCVGIRVHLWTTRQQRPEDRRKIAAAPIVVGRHVLVVGEDAVQVASRGGGGPALLKGGKQDRPRG